MLQNNDYRPQLLHEMSQVRRKLASDSLEVFAKLYLGNHFKLPPSTMHTQLMYYLTKATKEREQRIACAAPRGHAKSTVVTLAYILWLILFKKETFVLIISATREQAAFLLKEVKNEIQNNKLLHIDFPETCYPSGTKAHPKPWRNNMILLDNQVLVRALGLCQQLRGAKHSGNRPSLIVVDDLENQEHVQSAEMREKTRDWFNRTLLKAGSPETNIIVVGTVLHYDSLLAEITDSRKGRGQGARWTSKRFKAVLSFSNRLDLWDKWEAVYFREEEFEDESGPKAAKRFYDKHKKEMLKGTKVLWPERENYLDLMIMRATEGEYSFQSEKQNEPLDSERCLFSENSFRYWDKEFADIQELINAVGSNGVFFGACDPSLGRKHPQGDFTAIITLLKDTRSKIIYVIGAELARRKPNDILNRIANLARMYRYSDFVVETNQFQELLADQLKQKIRQEGLNLSIKKVNNTSNKQTRIESIEPLITQGTLRFCRRHTTLLEQLKQYPFGAHDDGPDALEMAASVARIEHYTVSYQV